MVALGQARQAQTVEQQRQQRRGLGLTRLARAKTAQLAAHQRHGGDGGHATVDDLLGKAARAGNGYRQYPPEAVERVGLIRLAQRLGFNLEQVQRILGRPGEPLNHQQILAGLQARLGEIEQMQATLAAQHSGLTCMLGKLQAQWQLSSCLPLARLLDGETAAEPPTAQRKASAH